MKSDFLMQEYLKARLKSIRDTDLTGRNFWFLLFFIVSCSLVWSVFIDKHLSADGVNYLCIILEKHNFTYIDWARQHSNYLIEWLVVLAVRSGVRDVQILSWLFGAGIYLTFLFSFILCYAALPGKNKVLLIFPVASMIAVNLSSDFDLIGEHHPMVLLAWPILFLVRRNDLNWLQQILLWGLLIIYSRLYQPAFFAGLIYLGVLAFRIKQIRNRNQLLRDIITCILCLAVSGIALYYIIYPRSEMNKESFFLAIPIVLFNRDVLINELFLIMFAIALFLRNRKAVFISLLPVLVYLIILLAGGQGISASQSFASRTLSMSILPVMMIFFLLFSYLNLKLTRASSFVFLIYVVIMVTGNIYYSGGWTDFHKQLNKITENNTGFVPIEKTDLLNNRYDWGWNNSQLGIVWSPSCVKSIILNEPGLKIEPFNPRIKLILKEYVKYDPFFLSIDKGISVCKIE
jgi:hypothetical protein